jgi:hypothetical protein
MYPYAPLQYVASLSHNTSLIREMRKAGLPVWADLDTGVDKDKKQEDILDTSWDLDKVLTVLNNWITKGDPDLDIAFDIILLNLDIRSIVNTYLLRDTDLDTIIRILSRSGYGSIPISALKAYSTYMWNWLYLKEDEKHDFFDKLPGIESSIYPKALRLPEYEIEELLQIIPDIDTESFLRLVLGYGYHHLRAMFFKTPRSAGSAVYPALKAGELLIKLKELDQGKEEMDDLVTMLGLSIDYDKKEFPTKDELDEEDSNGESPTNQ